MTTVLASKFTIGPRTDEERYGMRGHAGRPSDRVRRFVRVINGRRFEFSRIAWRGGRDGVTIRVYDADDPRRPLLHGWIF